MTNPIPEFAPVTKQIFSRMILTDICGKGLIEVWTEVFIKAITKAENFVFSTDPTLNGALAQNREEETNRWKASVGSAVLKLEHKCKSLDR
ncbi:MAG: hypothetical protein ACRDHZ_25315 [Ktedonobacteraceae bacterium]